ncbi:MAG: FGGY-family carbohydrate kinase [Clostridiaceae bacterium]|nr:FGGY-family carbohydrate kinase [Clostridiaceae bacterium]
MENRDIIEKGQAVLGIEFGSTRIKAVLIGAGHAPLASGSHQWENRLEHGVWTYTLDDIWCGLQACYRSLLQDVKEKYGVSVTRLAGIGFSAMMHGYMAFDRDGELLTPFRTWRNTSTEQAAKRLTEEFQYNIPQRWSVAHLYQAVLNREQHVGEIAYLTTLAGYVHWKMTGRKVIGIGDASGMFPVDSQTGQYRADLLKRFDALTESGSYPWTLSELLPEILCAGEDAGVLTEEGARLLDPDGGLQPGIPVCPPEGDAGTGMAATNSVAQRTGNVSAGTSVFAMIVLEKELKKVHREIDMVTTPAGAPVAMVHCNNCTSDINAWVSLFREAAELFGAKPDQTELFTKLFQKAEEGDKDCSGLLSYNYFSGEGVTNIDEGRPVLIRKPDASFTLANLMRTHLYSAVATLKMGLDILLEEEVQIDKMYGHGGFFTVPGAGQKIMAAAMNTPVSVMETAGEGGAWGIAVLAAYRVQKEPQETLAAYLNDKVFAGAAGTEICPDPADTEGFQKFMMRYRAGLAVERAAVEHTGGQAQ